MEISPWTLHSDPQALTVLLKQVEFADLISGAFSVNKSWYEAVKLAQEDRHPVDAIENLVSRGLIKPALGKVKALKSNPEWVEIFDYQTFHKINTLIKKFTSCLPSNLPSQLPNQENALYASLVEFKVSHPLTLLYDLITELNQRDNLFGHFEKELLLTYYREAFVWLAGEHHLLSEKKNLNLAKAIKNIVWNDILGFKTLLYEIFISSEANKFASKAKAWNLKGIDKNTYYYYYSNLSLILKNFPWNREKLLENAFLPNYLEVLANDDLKNDAFLQEIQVILLDPIFGRIFEGWSDDNFELELFHDLQKPSSSLIKLLLYCEFYLQDGSDENSSITSFIQDIKVITQQRILKVYLTPQQRDLQKVCQWLASIHLKREPEIAFKIDSVCSYFNAIASLPNPELSIKQLANLNFENQLPSIFKEKN